MGEMFDTDGRLHIPVNVKGEVRLPKTKVDVDNERYIIKEAYCPHGHSLISDTRINGYGGIHLVFTDLKDCKEVDIIISPVIGERKVIVQKGDVFKDGEIIKALCPTCRAEMEILFDCECGAHVYVFYLDRQLDHNFGQSFCSRIGCTKSSRLRYSREALQDFFKENIL
jgi:hypothetical protein